VCFEFFYNFVRIFFILRRIQRDMIIGVPWLSCERTFSLVRFELSQQIFEKYLYTKFHENPSSSRGVVPCGQTDMTKYTFCNTHWMHSLCVIDDKFWCKNCTEWTTLKSGMTNLMVGFRNFANEHKITQRSGPFSCTVDVYIYETQDFSSALSPCSY
jgi:hypothetical protein